MDIMLMFLIFIMVSCFVFFSVVISGKTDDSIAVELIHGVHEYISSSREGELSIRCQPNPNPQSPFSFDSTQLPPDTTTISSCNSDSHVIHIDDLIQRETETGNISTQAEEYPTRRGGGESSSEPSLPLLSHSAIPSTSQNTTEINQNHANNIDIELPSTSTPQGNPSTSLDSHHHQRNRSFKIGKTILGLSFQAALTFMSFHFQGSLPSSSSESPLSPSSSSSSIPYDIVGVSIVVGFVATLFGFFLQDEYPIAARIGEYTGVFSTAVGFFMMIKMLLPQIFSWIVWPAVVSLLLALIFALIAKSRGAGRI